MRKRNVLAMLGIIAAILILWIGSLWAVPKMARYLVSGIADCSNAATQSQCNDELARYGLVGDMFGAVNALFSGLAFSAIAIVFIFESRSRRESRKPLVIGTLDEKDGVTILRPLREAAVFLPIELEVGLVNQAPDAALNVGVLARIAGSNAEVEEFLESPLVGDKPRTLKLKLKLRGVDMETFLDNLTGQRAVKLSLSATYRSLEGINWMTSVVYELRCLNQAGEFATLNSARAGTWEDAGQWDAQALISLDAKQDKQSWAHNAKR
jgi:hypothetical protein